MFLLECERKYSYILDLQLILQVHYREVYDQASIEN